MIFPILNIVNGSAAKHLHIGKVEAAAWPFDAADIVELAARLGVAVRPLKHHAYSEQPNSNG